MTNVCICWLNCGKNYNSNVYIIAAQLVKKFSAVCLNIKFHYPVDKRSLLLSVLSQKNRVDVLILCSFRISFNIILLTMLSSF
jgi:hypothetical protein